MKMMKRNKGGWRVGLAVAALVVGGVCAEGAQVFCELGDFQLLSVTNRKVLVRPVDADVSSTKTLVADPKVFDSGSGTFWISNMVSGNYTFEIQGPPASKRYNIFVPDTNGVLNVRSLLTAPTNGLPAGSVAWSITASDERYWQRGEALTNAGVNVAGGTNVVVTTNGASVTVSAEVGRADLANVARVNTNQVGVMLTNANGFVVTIAADTNLAAHTNINLPSGLGSGGGGTSGALTNNETRDVTVYGAWNFPGGLTAPGLAGFSLSVTAATTNNNLTAVWTNTLVGSNSYDLEYWGLAAAPTNPGSFHRRATFWRGSGDALVLGSNQFSKIGAVALDAYATTNQGSNIVLYLRGPTNENANWLVNGFATQRTNATASGQALVAVNPTNRATCTMWLSPQYFWPVPNGSTVTFWSDFSPSANHMTTGANPAPPTKTVDTNGQAVLSFAVGQAMSSSGAMKHWTNWFHPQEGTIIMRLKPRSDGTRMMWCFGTTTKYAAAAHLPYQGNLYFAWGTNTTAGQLDAGPMGSSWLNNWHTVIMRRYSDGTMSMRVDGTTIASASGFTAYPDASMYMWLGSYATVWYSDMEFRGMATFRAALSDYDADCHAKFIEDLIDGS